MRGDVVASSTRQSGRAPGTRDGPPRRAGTLEEGPHVAAFLQLGASLDETGGQDNFPVPRDRVDIERLLAATGRSPLSLPGQHAARVARGAGAAARVSTQEMREPSSMSLGSRESFASGVEASFAPPRSFAPPQLSLRSGNISRERVNYFAAAGRREAPSPAGAVPAHAAGCEVVASLVPTETPRAATSIETTAGPAGSVAPATIAAFDQPLLANSRLSGWSVEKIARHEY